jgi:pyruvate/2-oxoglutarate dehydrogenase complex dihydrolipoamide dehydrogenase (E3) component
MNRIVVGGYGSPAAGAAAELGKSVAMIERSDALSGAKPP